MTLPRRFVALGVVVLAACQAAPSTGQPMTDTERNEIAATITRLAATVDDKVDRATCLTKLEIFEGREPVVAANGMTARTVADLKAFCPEGVEPPSRFDIAQTDVHVLSPDTAYIVRQGVLTNKLGMPGQTRLRYAVTQIFNRIGNDWRMAHHHESFEAIED